MKSQAFSPFLLNFIFAIIGRGGEEGGRPRRVEGGKEGRKGRKEREEGDREKVLNSM